MTRRARIWAVTVTGVGVAVLGVAIAVQPDVRNDAPGPAGAIPDVVPWQDVTWERVDPPSMGGPLNQRPVVITRIPGGVLVVGRDAEGDEGRQTEFGAVWVSPDGRNWEEHVLDDGVPIGDVSEPQLAAGGPAGLLVAGGVCCSVESAALWHAPAGLAFERVDLPAGAERFVPYALEAGPTGFVAAGATWAGDPNDPAYQAAILTSEDGRDWSLVDPDTADLPPGWVSDVAWTDQGWVAVGSADDGDTSDGAVWRSADGVAWTRIAAADPAITGPDEQGLGRVFPLGRGLFATGSTATHDDREQCEDALGDIVGVKGAVLALSCGWGAETHWTSPDGLTWTREPAVDQAFDGPPLPPGPGGRRLVSYRVMAAGGPGIVVVDAEGTTPDGHDDVGTWATADGETWMPVGAAGQLDDGLYLQDVTVVGRTLIGVGEGPFDAPTGTDIVVWIGTIRP